MDYHDQQVVVTGGTGALGVAVVGGLLAAGAVCHVPYRNDEEMRRFPHRDHPKVSLVPLGDLADELAVSALYGGLDKLWASIHVAGGFAFAPITQSDKSVLMTQLESNLISTYLCSRAAIAAFRRGGGGGRIVNIAARQALESRLGANLTAYAVAKSGVVALTIALAEEVAKEGILVNAVAPSIMDTPANRVSMPNADFNAWPKVEEVAATILFLASPQNKVTRGAIVPTYGKA
ncbi:MAG TPA: SDR family NAD(P)-dependent oxidoreductase [Steroidobacteraceae bacterium]|jgi:NAD(P)-dependent dehydrogenase (short-subunit alcohol dehydrogenase family)